MVLPILLCLFASTHVFADTVFDLPKPEKRGAISLEEVLIKRRSVREFDQRPLSLPQLSQLLFACQGESSESGMRTAPSAGGLYPLNLYVLAGLVEALPQGVYRYEPASHRILQMHRGDKRERLSHACLRQPWVKEAPVSFVLSADYRKTMAKYGERGRRYVQIEVGHAAQNLLLQATALGLAACPVGAFRDEEVKGVVGLGEGEEPLYVVCVGRRRL